MRWLRTAILVVITTLLFSWPAFAATRVALVIGNSAYEKVVRLGNPANDAGAMARVLREAGFDDVELRQNAKIGDMRQALREFADKTRDADVAVLYYAGHGIEVDGANYVIPVDAALERDLDVYDETISLDRILITMQPAKQLRLIILDACRDSPFAKNMQRMAGTRSLGRGLAKVEPASPNTLIAFASKAGATASDGDSQHSPFTTALIKHIATPGLDLRRAFGYVRDDVLKMTGNKQEPYLYGSLGGDDVPLVPAKLGGAATASTALSDMLRDYQLAERIGTREVWAAFLTQYPDGLYATLAKEHLDKIASKSSLAVAKNCGAGSTLAKDGSCGKSDDQSGTRPPDAVVSGSADQAKQRAGSSGSGDATKESFAVMGEGTIKSGQTVTVTARNGRKMTCTGGDNRRNLTRRCVWN